MRLYTLVLAVVASLFGSLTGAWAFDCNSLIVDGAGTLNGDTAGITDAASRLSNLGATVHVVTVSDYGSAPDLHTFEEKTMRPSCPSWMDTAGGMRSGLILFVVEKAHRKLGIYYGAQWNAALDGQTQSIQNNIMVPHLRDGDVPAAFVAGIGEVTRLVDLQLHPPKTTGTVIVQNQGPAVDYSGVWKLFLLLVLVAAVVGGGAIALSRRSRTQSDNRAAKQAAETAKASCASAQMAFDETTKAVLAANVSKAKGVLNSQDAQALDRQLAAVVDAYDSAAAEFARLDGIASNDPSAPNLSAAEYQQIATVYKQLLQKFSAAEKGRQELEAGVKESLAAAESAPQKVATAKAALAQLATTITGLAVEGFKVSDLQASQSAQTAQLAAAEQAVVDKQLASAAKKADAVLAAVDDIATAALSLRRQQQDAIAKVKALRDAVPGAEQAVNEAGQIVASFNGVYVTSSWTSLAQNVDAAAAALKSAQQSLDTAGKAAAKDVLDWATVKSSLSSADRVIRQAAGMAKEAQALRVALETAKRGAASSVQAAQSACDEAGPIVRQFAADSDVQPARLLRNARERLDGARAKLNATLPDYLAVSSDAKDAAGLANQAAALARSQHKQEEQKRQQVVDTARAAERERADRIRRARQDDLDRARERERSRHSSDDFTNGVIVGSILSSNNGGGSGSGHSDSGSSHRHSNSSGSDSGSTSSWGSSGGSDSGSDSSSSGGGSDSGSDSSY